MSWAHLHHKHSTSFVLDCEEYNDNLASFAMELDGNLNEQNFQVLILEDVIAAGQADPGIGAKLVNAKSPRDPHDFAVSGLVIPQSERWVRVVDTELTFVSRGGKVLVIYSFQCHMDPLTFQTGLNFCIELDGAARMDALLGTGDQGNDFTDGGLFILDPAGIPVEFDYGTSPSFRATQTPHQVYGVFEVEPGEHFVHLMARNLGIASDSSDVQWVTNCEGIALDGWC